MAETLNSLRTRFGAAFFASIPQSPGVYFMRGKAGRILYIGKAKSLRNRLVSYCNVKPGSAGDNIVELLPKVKSIDWELHATEALAFARERELIRVLVPPHNVADAWTEDYLYIGLRAQPTGIDFCLSSREEVDGFCLHGCYNHRTHAKRGYSALLRLLFACSFRKERFRFPARLARPSPLYNFSWKVQTPQTWYEIISKFLHGRRSRLPSVIVEELLGNEVIPPYVRPGLQKDLETLRTFSQGFTRSRNRLAIKTQIVSHALLRDTIRRSVPGSI